MKGWVAMLRIKRSRRQRESERTTYKSVLYAAFDLYFNSSLESKWYRLTPGEKLEVIGQACDCGIGAAEGLAEDIVNKKKNAQE